MMSQPTRLRRLARLALLIVIGFGAYLMLLCALENSMIYPLSKYPVGNWTLRDATVEDVWFDAADGTRLHGWYFPHSDARAVALFAHGNGGNVALWSPAARALRDRHRLSVFLFDYRGYGRSAGSPDEAGILQDARAARAWLARRTSTAERDVVLFGQSLGGGVMVDLAARDGARGLVLIRSFSSLPDLAACHFPWVPVRLLMRHKLDSCSKIADYRGPLLFCHGDADTIVPIEFGRKLFAAANEPKQFVLHARGEHNDPLPEDYHRALDDFLGALPPTGGK